MKNGLIVTTFGILSLCLCIAAPTFAADSTSDNSNTTIVSSTPATNGTVANAGHAQALRDQLAKMTPEQRQDYFKQKRAAFLAKHPQAANASPEAKAAMARNQALRDQLAKMTPEQRQDYFKQKRAAFLAKHPQAANASPEAKAAMARNQALRDQLAKMTPEQRQIISSTPRGILKKQRWQYYAGGRGPGSSFANVTLVDSYYFCSNCGGRPGDLPARRV